MNNQIHARGSRVGKMVYLGMVSVDRAWTWAEWSARGLVMGFWVNVWAGFVFSILDFKCLKGSICRVFIRVLGHFLNSLPTYNFVLPFSAGNRKLTTHFRLN